MLKSRGPTPGRLLIRPAIGHGYQKKTKIGNADGLILPRESRGVSVKRGQFLRSNSLAEAFS